MTKPDKSQAKQTAIVRPPGRNFAAGLSTAVLGAPDYELALQQHEAYCAALMQCGLKLIRLEADEHYPDATFVEDTAVLTPECAFVTRPGAPSRTGEVAEIRKVFASLFTTVKAINEPGTLDGGDVCEVGSHFFIGISERTNEAGASQLAGALAEQGYTSSLIDIRGVTGLLHLKSGLADLGNKRLVVVEALQERKEFRGYELIAVDRTEEYAANCLVINGRVLVASGYPAFAAKLHELGYRTLALDVSEFQKMDGGLSCLSLRF